MVGAGAVVTKNIPDYALVFGNPAELHGNICECSEKLEFHDSTAKCKCGKYFRMEKDIVTRIK